MNLTFQPSHVLPARVLLDKGVARRVYEFRVRVAKNLPPTQLQTESMIVFRRLIHRAVQLYITTECANILQRRQPRYAKTILIRAETLSKGRYLRRWARRLRSFGFSPEDAVVTAYASFGLISHSQIARVEVVVTNDLRLAKNFKAQKANIEDRFKRMVSNLLDPYSSLKLPEVVTTADALAST